ncbi:MAG: hypothetical protein LGR52_04415 [Candidatus Thiosymbion ectosymbiont of Robbea hypermnestra]|nr:hypothetical protein [Candidatus Thiosymbion ectosymbiont of Robbea hypermnestra]
MTAIAAAPSLVAAGPPGWVALGISGIVTVAVSAAAIMEASEQADEDFADEELSGVQSCPKAKTCASEDKEKPEELPKNPDDLLDEGYEETTHPEARKKGKREFLNPKTGDKVRFEKGDPNKTGWKGKDHWHRYNPNATGKRDLMLDKNGNPAPKGSNTSHIEPK